MKARIEREGVAEMEWGGKPYTLSRRLGTTAATCRNMLRPQHAAPQRPPPAPSRPAHPHPRPHRAPARPRAPPRRPPRLSSTGRLGGPSCPPNSTAYTGWALLPSWRHPDGTPARPPSQPVLHPSPSSIPRKPHAPDTAPQPIVHPAADGFRLRGCGVRLRGPVARPIVHPAAPPRPRYLARQAASQGPLSSFPTF